MHTMYLLVMRVMCDSWLAHHKLNKAYSWYPNCSLGNENSAIEHSFIHVLKTGNCERISFNRYLIM